MDDIGARIARIEQRVDELDKRTTAMTPIITTVATLSERVGTLQVGFSEFRRRIDERDDDFRKRFDERDEDLRNRDDQSRKERQAAKRWAITLTVTLLIGLMAACATVIASVIH